MSKTAHVFCWFMGSFLIAFTFMFGVSIAVGATLQPSAFFETFLSAIFAAFWAEYAQDSYRA